MNELLSKVNEYIQGAQNFYPILNLRQVNGTKDNFSFEFNNSRKAINTTDYAAINHRNFIHYTSIKSLFSIINNKEIRLYNLHNLNDPKELNYALEKIGINKNEINIEKYKNCLFLMSLSGYDENSNRDDFNLWRLYGQDGLGAAIIFEITNIEDDWQNAYFGKVLYGENKELDKLKQFINFHHQFNNPTKYINNYPSIIPAFSLFHKSNIWQIENEYRLFIYSDFDKNTLTQINTVENHLGFSEINHSVNAKGQQTAYVRLPLNIKEFKQQMEQKYPGSPFSSLAIRDTPNFKIKEILLGYNINDKIYEQIVNLLSKIIYQKLGYNVSINYSYLKADLS